MWLNVNRIRQGFLLQTHSDTIIAPIETQDLGFLFFGLGFIENHYDICNGRLGRWILVATLQSLL